jgi:type I restriction enzyme S subunit
MSNRLNKKMPKLRFSEFEGRWEIKKLGDICDCIVPGRNKPKTFNGNIPWITTPDIEQGKINVFSTSLKISYEEAQSIGSKVVPKGSVLMSCVGELGITAITDCEVVINQQLHAFIPHDIINNYFLFHSIKTQKKYIDSVATKTSVPYLNKNNCNSISIPLPSIAEQKKIASFLGAVDTRLTQLRRKHELLQTYKRGVMQKLFSQEIRFKCDDGKPFPDWEKKKLSDFSEPVKRQLESGEVTVMSISSGKGFVTQNERFSQVIAGSSLKKYILLNKYEFAYNRGASKLFPFGCIYMLTQEDFALIPFVYRAFQLKQGNRSFFAHYFLTGYLDKQLKEVISSSVRMDGLLNIGETDFFNINLPFPDEKEQKKIADFLTAIDQKIEAIAKQIDLTEQYKKGLLQKMFI